MDLKELFAPCYCVPVREALHKLREEADGGPGPKFLRLADQEILAGDLKIVCEHCRGTQVIPTEQGKTLLRAVLVHAGKQAGRKEDEVPF